MITANEILNEKIKFESMSDEDFFAQEIVSWLGGETRQKMLLGKDYYKGNHDILKRKRTAIGKNGDVEEVENIPNNIVVDNRFARMLDQKKNYLLGKPITIKSNDDVYYSALKNILNATFIKNVKVAGEESLVGGISWLYVYINEFGELKTKCFPSYEVCPFWKDSLHTELDCVARVYTKEVYENKKKKFVEVVDLYRTSGMTSYELDGKELVQKEKEMPYISMKGKQYNWKKLPIIPVKANAMEIPLINRVKQLQDALNLILSDFMNNMEENVRNSIIVLKNYDGTDLGEFRKNLSSYGAIKTRTQEGASGGVDVLKVDVNSQNYRTICDMLIKAITQNARGFDSLNSEGFSMQNQMSVMSMYSDIDLDANDMETEMQVAFSEMKYFFDVYLSLIKAVDCTGKNLEIVFNRDILINETELIENCIKSSGILSKETIIARHPWVNDVQKEIEQIETLSALDRVKEVKNPVNTPKNDV